ncbi:hypothetical protein [Hahella ganghwensis]|uniref:hypothetical protein n=1 Tax=Hahella ganghwensis TaxID=286420 RepID=UPI0003757BE7|nr:hypothetical protein [Hahella ganghwensis]
MYSGDQRTLYLDEAVHRKAFRDIKASSCAGLDIHAQWPFLLNTPPRTFLNGPEVPLSQLGTDNSHWLLKECERADSPSNLALSFQLPGWQPDSQNQYSRSQIQALRSVYQSPSALQRYIDYMVKEIQILRRTLPDQIRLTYMHWNGDLVHFLSESELTQLMFFINRSFVGINDPATMLVSELDAPPKSNDLLALLVGLGINTICINDPGATIYSFPLPDVKDWINLVRDYGINKVLLRLNLTDELADELPLYIEDIISAAPDAVLMAKTGSGPSAREGFEFPPVTVKHALLKARYTPMTDSFYVAQGWNSTNSHLVKGIGLGAKSYTTALEFYNTCGLTEYYQLLDAGKLPVNRARKLITELY